MVKTKQFLDFLDEDPSLRKKLTYEEFVNKKAAAPLNDDIPVSTAYEVYCETRDKFEK